MKQVRATHKDKPDCQYVWMDDSEQSLADWKSKRGGDFTFSALEDDPAIAKRNKIKVELEKITDPVARKFIKLLLKDALSDE